MVLLLLDLPPLEYCERQAANEEVVAAADDDVIVDVFWLLPLSNCSSPLLLGLDRLLLCLASTPSTLRSLLPAWCAFVVEVLLLCEGFCCA